MFEKFITSAASFDIKGILLVIRDQGDHNIVVNYIILESNISFTCANWITNLFP